METTKKIALGKLLLIVLSFIFLLAHLLFSFQVLQDAHEDIVGFVMIAGYFFLFIFLFYQGYGWAKWVLSVSLILFSLLVFFTGLEIDSTILKLISIFYLYFGVIPHFSTYLQSLTHREIPKIDNTTPIIEELEEGSFAVNDSLYEYPLLLKRYQALFIDGMLILTVTLICFVIMDENETGQWVLRILFLIVSFSYEPLLTSYSTTIGQKLTHIRVRAIDNPNKRISLGKAYLRFFTKGLLGWLSFITIHFNPEHRAIHDFAGSSVMIKVSK